MSKPNTLPPDAILPTLYEERLGEIFDPRGHEGSLTAANLLLASFLQSMNAGQVPEQNLEHIREAVGTLGQFAGYPKEAHEMEMFLESPLAASNYKAVAHVLSLSIRELNDRIAQRVTRLTTLQRSEPNSPQRRLDGDDIPPEVP
jgi:hypothetical protein